MVDTAALFLSSLGDPSSVWCLLVSIHYCDDVEPPVQSAGTGSPDPPGRNIQMCC